MQANGDGIDAAAVLGASERPSWSSWPHSKPKYLAAREFPNDHIYRERNHKANFSTFRTLNSCRNGPQQHLAI
jgi:hypothetical protein